MTSLKSLQNNFGYSFKTGIRNNAIVGVINAIFLAALYGYIPIASFSGATGKLKYDFLFTAQMEFLRYPVIIILLGIGILMGITAFKFITGKKTVNVYYSLGIKRTHLFMSKFLAGATVLFLSVLLPLAVSFIINVITLGFNKYMLISIVYLVLGLFSISFVSYSITALVFSTVGTAFEGVLFSGIVVLFPEIFFRCVETLIKLLVFGSPYGQSFSQYNYMEGTYKLSLLQKYPYINPLRYFSEGIFTYSSATDEAKLISYTSGDFVAWKNPNFLPVICWLLVSTAIFALALFAYERRKAEIGGFIGKNKVLNFVGTFVISFFAFSLLISYPFVSLGNFVLLLIGLVLFLAISIALYLILLRNVKAFKKSLIVFPIQAAVVILIFVFFSTGYFGQANKIPEAADIQYAQISSVSVNNVAENDRMSSYYGMSQIELQNTTHPIGKYETENDINYVRNIHQSIIDQGELEPTIYDDEFNGVYPLAVQIKYILKDGSAVYRNYYGITKETIDMLNNADSTDYRTKRLDDIFHGAYSEYKKNTTDTTTQQAIENDYNNYKLELQSDDSTVTLYNNLLKNDTVLELTPQLKKQLRECIYKDLTTISSADKYTPASTLGAISFYLPALNNDTIETESYETTSYSDGKVMYSSQSSVDMDDSSTGLYNESGSWYSANRPNFIITDKMTNTVEFLRANGYYDVFATTPVIKSVAVVSINDLYTTGYMARYGKREILSGGSSIGHEVVAYPTYEPDYIKNYFNGAYTTKNAEEIKQLASHSVLRASVNNKGYIAVYSLDDGSYIKMYIADEFVPETVKSGVSAATFDTWW